MLRDSQLEPDSLLGKMFSYQETSRGLEMAQWANLLTLHTTGQSSGPWVWRKKLNITMYTCDPCTGRGRQEDSKV